MKLTSKKLIITGIILLLLISWLTFSVFIPLSRSDGLEKFEGEKRIAASSALNKYILSKDHSPLPTLRIDEVVEVTELNSQTPCQSGRYSNDPADEDHYKIIFRSQELFNFNTWETEYNPCD